MTDCQSVIFFYDIFVVFPLHAFPSPGSPSPYGMGHNLSNELLLHSLDNLISIYYNISIFPDRFFT